MINPVDLGCKTMPKNLLALKRDNPFDKFQLVPSSEKSSLPFEYLKRQRKRSYVTDQRKAGKDCGKTKPAQVSSGKDHALTEEQILTTPPYIPAFDIARKTMSQYSPLKETNCLVC